MKILYLFIVLLPLAGACLSGLFGKQLGHKKVISLATASVFISCLFTVIALYVRLQTGKPVIIIYYDAPIFHYNFGVGLGIMYNKVIIILCLMVTLISALIHLYLEVCKPLNIKEESLSKLISFLSYNTFLNVLYLTSSCFILMFVSWISIGGSSYLLVNFWLTRIRNKTMTLKQLYFLQLFFFTLSTVVLNGVSVVVVYCVGTHL